MIGAGAWGTTLARHLAEKGHSVRLWAFEPEVCAEINRTHENRTFLPGFPLPESVTAHTSLREAVEGREVAILAVPSHGLRAVVRELAPYLERNALLACCTKGIENDTLKLPSQIIQEFLAEDLFRRSCYISGPNFAKEIASRLPAATTIASRDEGFAKKIQQLLTTDYFRAYTHHDVLGIQLGGSVKNVIAIAAGISDGMGFGHNARAALISRGVSEMTRLGVKMGAAAETFSGLSGMGDLVLTCTGDLSRNRRVGLLLAEGIAMKDIFANEKSVAEGVLTSKSVMGLSEKHGVDMPICREVYQVLHCGKSPSEALASLMGRSPKKEFAIHP